MFGDCQDPQAQGWPTTDALWGLLPPPAQWPFLGKISHSVVAQALASLREGWVHECQAPCTTRWGLSLGPSGILEKEG